MDTVVEVMEAVLVVLVVLVVISLQRETAGYQ